MTIAEQSLKSALRRRMARSVVIKDAESYKALYRQLQTAMTNAWDDAMREGIAAALDRLRDLGPGKFTQDDGAMILRVLEGSVGAEAIAAAMREPVINLTDAFYRVGAEEVGKATGVAIAFMRPDLDALDVLKSGNLYWVGNSWNVRTQNLMAQTLEDYFTKGMTREDLTARMAEDFGTLAERGRRYWEILADHTATKTRELGRVTGYERAGIAHVQVRAHLDERTTKICRQMHGRIIPVSKMRDQANAYLDAVSVRNEPAAKEAWVMHGADADLSDTPTSKLAKGVAGPPYHFQCRTITVAYFEAPKGMGKIRQKVTDREGLGKAERAQVIERAKMAGFLGEKQARAKFQRHRANLPTKRLKDYEADARGLIDDPNVTLLLSNRVPLRNKESAPGQVALHAVFAKPAKDRDGRKGELVTVLDMEENVIISHHWRTSQASEADVSPAMVVKSKGVLAWLIG